jgi:hypothetical protein
MDLTESALAPGFRMVMMWPFRAVHPNSTREEW